MDVSRLEQILKSELDINANLHGLFVVQCDCEAIGSADHRVFLHPFTSGKLCVQKHSVALHLGAGRSYDIVFLINRAVYHVRFSQLHIFKHIDVNE